MSVEKVSNFTAENASYATPSLAVVPLYFLQLPPQIVWFEKKPTTIGSARGFIVPKKKIKLKNKKYGVLIVEM